MSTVAAKMFIVKNKRKWNVDGAEAFLSELIFIFSACGFVVSGFCSHSYTDITPPSIHCLSSLILVRQTVN